MLPGPTIVRECSACSKLIAEATIISGNTFGARQWTDGKLDAPMFPDQPLLVKCPHCGTLVWITEQKQVGKAAKRREDKPNGAFSDAHHGITPTLSDYEEFLKAGISDARKEYYVRLRAWWTGNDSRRESNNLNPLSCFERENLLVFVTMLSDETSYERLMKAEVFRELGEFKEAGKLLLSEFDEELITFVSIIRGLNEKGNVLVSEIAMK
jgi:phage FluMu protein Com